MAETFKSLIEYRAGAHPLRTAYMFEDKVFSYKEFNNDINRVAHYFTDLGLKKGDRIGILDLNNDLIIQFFHAAINAGIIPVPLNYEYNSDELAHVIKDSTVKHVFYSEYFEKVVKDANREFNVPSHVLETLYPKIQKEYKDKTENLNVEVNTKDCLFHLYTSGTTGYPKGVPISNANLFFELNKVVNETPCLGSSSVNLVEAKLHSMPGIGFFILGLYVGCTNVLLEMFSPKGFCEAVQEYKVTNGHLAPVMMQSIVEMKGSEVYDFSSLQHIQYGGSPSTLNVIAKAIELFECYMTQGYGLTETTGISTLLRFDDHVNYMNDKDSKYQDIIKSVGRPLHDVELVIMKADGSIAGTNESGEVCLRGPNVIDGYWNLEERNEKMFDDQGWFHSGDVGFLDSEGYLFLVDRINDMIVSRGINIFPAEVEKELLKHPRIKDVAVVGIPHDLYGEGLCVIAVPFNGEMDDKDLLNWCIDHLPEYKRPIRVEWKNELPRSPRGKLLRRKLRAPFWEGKDKAVQ
ncbi:MAG: AMP-binding protein [Chitinophagales bacterium]|nr:AMP-binding protein [Chitinophagales bacterium]